MTAANEAFEADLDLVVALGWEPCIQDTLGRGAGSAPQLEACAAAAGQLVWSHQTGEEHSALLGCWSTARYLNTRPAMIIDLYIHSFCCSSLTWLSMCNLTLMLCASCCCYAM